MAAVRKVFVARLAGLVVLGPDGESIGRVRDVAITARHGRQQARVLGLNVELFTRKRIFVPILRVTAIEPGAVTLNTTSVSLRRFVQRPTEVLVLAQVLDSKVRVADPELTELAGLDVTVVDVEIELARTREWFVSRVAVRRPRGRLRRSGIEIVEWQHVVGLTPSDLELPNQGVSMLLQQFESMKPPDLANALRDLPEKRRREVVLALDDERLADVVQELPDDDQVDVLTHLESRRAADVLEAMDPDDAADLLGELTDAQAEALLRLMDPQESAPVRRLLEHSPESAGGLMTPEPVILDPSTTVAEALARARNADLSPALASLVFVVRPPTATPTGRYIGCAHLQRLLREPPASLVGGVLDTGMPILRPEEPLSAITRYFALYNLVCGPVVDAGGHLLGAVTVDDVLDHLLPEDWRDQEESR